MSNAFQHQYRALCSMLLDMEPFHTGSWQSTDTSAQPLRATYELQDVVVRYDMPDNVQSLAEEVQPNLPWAEIHFGERVGGRPVNPPPSNEIWPWARHNKRFQVDGEGTKPFSHSYPERMWPRYRGYDTTGLSGNFTYEDGKLYRTDNNGFRLGGPIDVTQFPRTDRMGIRYRYGDLNDVLDLLVREPLTRQAYVPIWFPEDTGTHHGERVPCTLGYHFMIRDGRLSCRYYMRSCDAIRHFLDDVYMACRLTQWFVEEFNSRIAETAPPASKIEPGNLIMYITSFHAFKGDEWKLRQAADGKI